MPTRYSTPGVYVERFDADAQRIKPRRTDVAGFVGVADRGPLHTPVKIESVRQFTTQFGDPLPFSFLAYAVSGFFANGGRRCWVVRVADPTSARRACMRLAIEGRGAITLEAISPGVWGARTMSSDSMWKYINVRRLFIFIEQSIDRGTQWAVFEPNSEPTWIAIRTSITNFLRTVWRNGALMGTTQEAAFFVKCDRTTMTQDDFDNGRLICLIGVAPVKPAELFIFRMWQTTI